MPPRTSDDVAPTSQISGCSTLLAVAEQRGHGSTALAGRDVDRISQLSDEPKAEAAVSATSTGSKVGVLVDRADASVVDLDDACVTFLPDPDVYRRRTVNIAFVVSSVATSRRAASASSET